MPFHIPASWGFSHDLQNGLDPLAMLHFGPVDDHVARARNPRRTWLPLIPNTTTVMLEPIAMDCSGRRLSTSMVFLPKGLAGCEA